MRAAASWRSPPSTAPSAHDVGHFQRFGRAPCGQVESLADPAGGWRSRCGTTAPPCARHSPPGSWPRPQIAAQELTGHAGVPAKLPETRHLATNFTFPPSDSGEALFQSKGCSGCHTGKLALEGLLRNQTLTDIAAEMWNHQPQHEAAAPLALAGRDAPDHRLHLGAPVLRGNGKRGARPKGLCGEGTGAACHNDPSSGAPKLAQGKNAYSDITLVAALWEHGPACWT